MTTLTFNFKDSNRPVDHEVNTYIGLGLGLNIVSGWEGERFPVYSADVIHDPVDPGTEKDPYPNLLPDLFASVGLTEAQALYHAPGPDYYDNLNFNVSPLFLRVKHNEPAPPNWNDYVKPPYDTLSQYQAADANFEFNHFQKWQASIRDGNPLVTEAGLGDGGGIFGKVIASSPLYPFQLAEISHYATIVDGSKFNDTIHGASHHDKLNGEAGDDLLIAGNGHQTLNGGLGDDTLVAGHGHDIMTGGHGADLFRFNLHGDSPPARPDVIMDFHRGQGDKIDIDGFGLPDLVLFIGHESFAHRHQHNPLAFEMVRIVPVAPGTHLVQATDDGGKHVSLAIVVHGSVSGEGDFIFHT